MDWFTADLHLGHDAIRIHCDRPFASTDEMDEAILGNINESVGATDTLYILGDFAWQNIEQYRRRINCENVYLIIGNHDRATKTGQPLERHDTFSGVYTLYRYKTPLAERRITLCHYPMESWQGSAHGSWHLHGHSHGRPSGDLLRLDVGVDCWDYGPVSIEGIVAILKAKAALLKRDFCHH